MWPTVQRAADYLNAHIEGGVRLIASEQDLWEETGGYLTYTNASAAAGLQSAALWALEVGRENHAARWRKGALTLRREIQNTLCQEGFYVGEKNPRRTFPMREDYLLDISNLGLSFPFRVIPPDRPEMAETARRLEAAMQYPISGVGRYASDLFVGGNPWSLSAIWLALYYAEAGQVQEVQRHLAWCLKYAMLHDFLPEQSNKHTGAPASAAPLAWSHAWMIVVLQRLGRLVGGSDVD
jgi:GH15 family glucan-1,4-alpha-glucosidase